MCRKFQTLGYKGNRPLSIGGKKRGAANQSWNMNLNANFSPKVRRKTKFSSLNLE